MGWDGRPEQNLIFYNLRRKTENPCSFNKNRLLQGCALEEPGPPWGLTFAPGILETCCEGVSSQVVNTSNSGSGGPGFKPRQSHCFLRQGTLLCIQVYKMGTNDILAVWAFGSCVPLPLLFFYCKAVLLKCLVAPGA